MRCKAQAGGYAVALHLHREEYTPAPEDVFIKRLRKWAVDRFRLGAPVLRHPLIIEAFLLSRLAAREIVKVALRHNASGVTDASIV